MKLKMPLSGPGDKDAHPIHTIGDLVPACVTVHDANTLAIIYINQTGCKIFDRTKEEITSLGHDFFHLFFHPDEVAVVLSELTHFIENADLSKTYSFFHRIKPAREADFRWYFTNSKLVSDEKTSELRLLNLSLEISRFNFADKQIHHFFKEEQFIRDNYKNFLSLTPREKEIIALIAKGKHSNFISRTLFISIHTVNNHRKNIIRKLGVETMSKIVKFAEAFDLI